MEVGFGVSTVVKKGLGFELMSVDMSSEELRVFSTCVFGTGGWYSWGWATRGGAAAAEDDGCQLEHPKPGGKYVPYQQVVVVLSS